jgi:hypothetical protein
MKALIEGVVVSYDDALAHTQQRMLALGITQPRVRIGERYEPPRQRNGLSRDEERIQSGLLKRRTL